MGKDLVNNIDIDVLLCDTVVTADNEDGNSASVDRLNFHGLTLVMISVLASGDTLAFNVQHCDDDSTWVDCDEDDLIGDEDDIDHPGNTTAATKIGYKGNKRYVRVQWDGTGIAAASPLTILAIKHGPRYAPA